MAHKSINGAQTAHKKPEHGSGCSAQATGTNHIKHNAGSSEEPPASFLSLIARSTEQDNAR